MTRDHAYAYEAGYRDGSINYELEHCPSCQNVADIQELRDMLVDLWRCAMGKPCCFCDRYDGPDNHDHIFDTSECGIGRRMLELGIEVDG